MSQETTTSRPQRRLAVDLLVLLPLFTMLALWVMGLAFWFRTQDVLLLIFFGYVGLFVGAGIGGYIGLPERYRPYGRSLVMLMMGGLLLVVAFVTDHGNMQIEGLFFAVLAGVGPWIVLHYLIAKIAGPLLFGRVWCGWACWYGMIFDLLPYPFSRFRYRGRWGLLRYFHFGASLLVVALLVIGYQYQQGAEGSNGMLWFVIGLLSYYVVGIVMALVLRDNRAFCKYLCPIAVPLKLTSRFSLLKIAGTPEKCDTCEACIEMCPMNIRIKDYLQAGQRVLSTECTLCQTCINVCPHNSLRLSVGLDVGGREIYDYDPPKARR